MTDIEQAASFYQQVTPDIVSKWEQVSTTNPEAAWNCNNIKALLPFLKNVLPRVGQNQSLFGFSIISLEGSRLENEDEVVRYGLEPLKVAGILTEDDVTEITSWYSQNEPTGFPGVPAGQFKKDFEIEGQPYRLITDCYAGCRDLNLQIRSEK